MPFGDLTDTLAVLTVSLDGEVIQDQGSSTDLLSFEPGTPHSGAHSLDDQIAFQFSDGADDDHDSPAQRSAGIDVFPRADVLDLETTELVQDLEEMLDLPGDPIRGPDQDHIEPAAAGICHHLIEARPPGLRTADSVGVFVDNLEATLAGHLAKIVELCFRMLIDG